MAAALPAPEPAIHRRSPNPPGGEGPGRAIMSEALCAVSSASSVPPEPLPGLSDPRHVRLPLRARGSPKLQRCLGQAHQLPGRWLLRRSGPRGVFPGRPPGLARDKSPCLAKLRLQTVAVPEGEGGCSKASTDTTSLPPQSQASAWARRLFEDPPRRQSAPRRCECRRCPRRAAHERLARGQSIIMSCIGDEFRSWARPYPGRDGDDAVGA